MAAGTLTAEPPRASASPRLPALNPSVDDFDCEAAFQGSPYIPVDSWIYPAVLRLYSLGYVDTVYLNMRPWTRANLGHMLEEAADRLEDQEGDRGASEAQQLYDALKRESDSYD